MRIRNGLVAQALVALVLGALAATPMLAKNLIFELEDPRGDDHGDGSLIYPLRTEFQKGDLDLIKFSARRLDGGTQFEAVFAQPIRVAGREAVDELGTQLDSLARLGFYTFNIDVYIDQDRAENSGAVAMLPGRLAEVQDAWDRAIILTPRPNEARGSLQRLMVRSVSQELRRADDEEVQWSVEDLKATVPDDLAKRVYFPNRVRVRGKKITFLVPDSFLGGPADPSGSYTVVVSGSDLMQSLDLAASMGVAEETQNNLMILPISPGTWKDRFGGARDGQDLQPPLVDILVPEGASQERILSDFSTRAGRPARVPGVVPAADKAPLSGGRPPAGDEQETL